MFKSATLKLTSWYVGIIISVSLLFSAIIFSIATSEVGNRINTLQIFMDATYGTNLTNYDEMREVQVHEAKNNLIASLLLANISIWIAGGFGSYYLAKRTLRPIEEAHEAQSRFTSDASHELRTPLASMKIELEVALRDEHLSKHEMKELLESNLEEVNKLTALSHNLLQLSRLEHDEIIREKVELTSIVQSIVDRFNKTHDSRIELKNVKPMTVVANASNVEELLTILLDNALKYSPDASPVVVSLIKKKQSAGFSVSNGGEGISPEVLPHIFNRFYRADHSRSSSSDQKGYGLGLSLAKKLVELHSGDLTVSSGKNKKTTFTVLLPLFQK